MEELKKNSDRNFSYLQGGRMFRKIMAVLVMIGLLFGISVRAFAGGKEIREADAAWNAIDAKAPTAETQYRELLSTVSGDAASLVQFRIGYFIHRGKKEHDYDKAITEYRKVAEVKDGTGYDVSEAQLFIGHCYRNQEKYAEAIEEYKKVAEVEDAYGEWVSSANLYIGHCLNDLKKYPEAQEAYLQVCNEDGNVKDFEKAFSKIKVSIVGIPKYLEYLKKLDSIIPAKPENAEFLSRIKSEIVAKPPQPEAVK